MNGVSHASGGVAEPALPPSSEPTERQADSADADADPPIPTRVLLYLRAGGLVLHCHTADNEAQASIGAVAVASPHPPPPPSSLKLPRLGFLLASLRGHLGGGGGGGGHPNADVQRLRLLQHDIVAVYGSQCVAVAIRHTDAWKRRAEARQAATMSDPSARRASVAAAVSSAHHSLVLQLRQVVQCCERTFGSALLPQLNERHQRLIDDMIRSDGIHKQMQQEKEEEECKRNSDDPHAPASSLDSDPDPLHNTRTIAQLGALEIFVRQVARRGDMRQRWFGDLLPFASVRSLQAEAASAPPLPTSSQLLAAHLIATGGIGAAIAAPLLLSHTVPQWAALNLSGPSNAGMWAVVAEYARALCARHTAQNNDGALAAAANSDCMAVSFPLSSPPLLVYLCPVLAPVAGPGCCLVVVEMGPTGAPISPSCFRAHSALPPAPSQLQWLDPALLGAAPPRPDHSSPSAPLLPPDHPLSLEQARHPRPFVLVDSESQLPAWHSSRVSLQLPQAATQLDQQQQAPSLHGAVHADSVWSRVCQTACKIESECTLPDPQSLLLPDTAPVVMSPTNAAATAAASATASTEPELEQPEPELEPDQSSSLVSPVSLASSADLVSPLPAGRTPSAMDQTEAALLDAPFVALLPIEPSPSPPSAPSPPMVSTAANAASAVSLADSHGPQGLMQSIEAAEADAQLPVESEAEEPSSLVAAAPGPSEPEPAVPSSSRHPGSSLRPTPPPQPAPSAPLESGGGTASFRRRKMHAATRTAATTTGAPVSAWKPHPPPSAPPRPSQDPPAHLALHVPAQQTPSESEPLPSHLAPSLPLAPVVARTASSGKQKLSAAMHTPPLPLPPAHPSVPSLGRVASASGAHAIVELSMDTPRLETTQVQVTPRLPHATKRASGSGAALFPPLLPEAHQDDQRESALAKLQAQPTDDEAF